MTEIADYLKQARAVEYVNDQDVVVDRFGVNFHEPDKLDFTMDMEEMKLEEASTESIPCSQCFSELHSYYQTQKKLEFGI